LTNKHWQATTTDGQVFEAKNVVLTLPSYEAAHLVAPHYPDVAQRLAHIHYTELAQVHMGFNENDIHAAIKGFGGLHPPSSGAFTSGVLWVSSVLPMRAPAGSQLLVAFVGGEGRPSISGVSTEEILDKVEAELRQLYQIDAPATVRHLRRWERAIPQYDDRMLGMAAAAEHPEADHLYLQANYIGGVSVQDCIKKALRLADRLVG
jgi:oxygen-dependent protoporphyrinogen oxidase